MLEEVHRITLKTYYNERFKEYSPLSLSKAHLEKNLISVYVRVEKKKILFYCIDV